MLYYKLITCDNDEYDFLNGERFNGELGLTMVEELAHRKLVSETSLIEEYYDYFYENYRYLSKIKNKASDDEKYSMNMVEITQKVSNTSLIGH